MTKNSMFNISSFKRRNITFNYNHTISNETSFNFTIEDLRDLFESVSSNSKSFNILLFSILSLIWILLLLDIILFLKKFRYKKCFITWLAFLYLFITFLSVNSFFIFGSELFCPKMNYFCLLKYFSLTFFHYLGLFLIMVIWFIYYTERGLISFDLFNLRYQSFFLSSNQNSSQPNQEFLSQVKIKKIKIIFTLFFLVTIVSLMNTINIYLSYTNTLTYTYEMFWFLFNFFYNYVEYSIAFFILISSTIFWQYFGGKTDPIIEQLFKSDMMVIKFIKVASILLFSSNFFANYILRIIGDNIFLAMSFLNIISILRTFEGLMILILCVSFLSIFQIFNKNAQNEDSKKSVIKYNNQEIYE